MKKKNKKGSLLIEALLSTVILAVSLTVIIQSMMASYRASVYTAEYTDAVFIVDNIISEYVQKGAVSSNINVVDESKISDKDFQYTLSSSTPEIAGAAGLNQLNLSVFWNSGKRKNNINIETFLFTVTNDSEETE